MKRGFYIILLMTVAACATVRYEGTSSVNLNFKNCGPDLGYTKIKLFLPEIYKLKKVVDDHGFCEYRFTYSNGAVLYVSSNVYYGSSLNYQNRLSEGIITYSENRSIGETIKNSGREEDGRYWLEWINANYVIGYVNHPDSVNARDIFLEVKLIDQ